MSAMEELNYRTEMAARHSPGASEQSEIARWYNGRSIFITGATGFMGKVLVEKLLSACPGLNKIYVLMRQKKEVSPDMRLEQLKQNMIFDKIRSSHPARLDKLIAVSGDIVLPEVGLGQQSLAALRDVSVIFHTAATVKFDEKLKLSVAMNVGSAKSLLNICKGLPKLESFVHVSTAYCNCDRSRVEEKIYPAPAPLAQVVTACECLDDQLLDELTKKMIGNRPNTYTFTKALAESVVLEHSGAFPIAIFRPSIVTASVESPFPGWVDNLNGTTGIFAGAGKGLLRSIHCHSEMKADLIPVDIAINTMIAVAWQTAIDKSMSVKVYNCTSGMQNPITWGDLEKLALENLVAHPFDDVFWYPGGSFKKNKYLNMLCCFLFHTIPAYTIDHTAWLFGRKPATSMVRLHDKFRTAIRVLEFFATHEWDFVNDNVRILLGRLSPADRQLFDFDVKRVQWRPYITQYVKGIRKYTLKEEDKNIPKAKRHLQKMHAIHMMTECVIVFIVFRSILSRSALARSIASGVMKYSIDIMSRLYLSLKSLS